MNKRKQLSKEIKTLKALSKLNVYKSAITHMDITTVSNYTYERLSREMIEIAIKKDKAIAEMRIEGEKSVELENVFKQSVIDLREMTLEEIGVDITTTKTPIGFQESGQVCQILAKRFGRLKLIDVLFGHEIKNVLEYIKNNKEFSVYVAKSFSNFGINEKLLQKYILSILNKDRSSYIQATEEFRDRFSEKSDLGSKNKFLEMVRLEMGAQNLFMSVEEDFPRQLYFVIPEVYIFKAAISIAISNYSYDLNEELSRVK